MTSPDKRKTRRKAAKRSTSKRPAAAPTSPRERVNATLTAHVAEIARDCGASAIFVYVDALGEPSVKLPGKVDARVFSVTKCPPEEAPAGSVVRVPDVRLTRMGLVKMAVLLALSRGLLESGQTIVCLSGAAGSGVLDTLVVMEVEREFDILLPIDGEADAGETVQPEVLERAIDLAAELGSEGREGRPVGTLFVIGDTERVLSLSRQLLLNPFRGYPEEERRIVDPALEETIKELASIDGAFVVRGDGVIESAGTYLKTTSQEAFRLPHGLGARHHAAAAITSVSRAVAVTVSESTGTVTIFRDGKIVTEIEKLRGGTSERNP